MLKKIMAFMMLVSILTVSCIAFASDLVIMSIPDCYAGEKLYIGGRYPGGEVTIKVYKPGEDEVYKETVVTTRPDHSFSFDCETDPEVVGEYRIEVFTQTESSTATANVKKKEPKPPVKDGINVMVDGEYVEFDQAPVIINDRTMVPVRAIFEKLNAEVGWNEAAREVNITKGDKTIVIGIDNPNAKINDEIVVLDQSAVIINERTLVPVRFVSEALDAEVDWDEEQQLVIINTK